MRLIKGSFIITILFMLQWSLAAVLYSFTPVSPESPRGSVTAFAPEASGYQQLAGNVMYVYGIYLYSRLSLAFTFVVPSWVNIKKKDVSTQGALWTTTAVSAMLYIFVGWIPASAFLLDPKSGNVIPPLAEFGVPQILACSTILTSKTKITTYLFPIIALMPSIPVSFLVTESNLIQNQVVEKSILYGINYRNRMVLIIYRPMVYRDPISQRKWSKRFHYVDFPDICLHGQLHHSSHYLPTLP